MGGFIFQAKDSPGFVIEARSSPSDIQADASVVSAVNDNTLTWITFRLTAEQLFYLVECGYIEPPKLSKRLIREKDKVDSAIRLLTLCQILWFIVNTSARAVQHLTITCIELTTAAFIFSAVGIAFCWAHKPADLVTPEVIKTEVSIQEILLRAGDRAQKPYLRTPLDFVDYEEWSGSQYFQHCVSILRKMHIPFGPRIVPLPAIKNTFILPLSDMATAIIMGLSCLYVALFFVAWNYTFPTQIERTLWRLATVVMLATIPIFWAITLWCYSWYPMLRDRFNFTITDRMNMKDAPRIARWPGHGRVARNTRSMLGSCINNSISKNEKLDIPLKALLPMYLLGFIYCVARTYIFVADAIELRLLPTNAYDLVNWASIVPHF